MTVAAVAAVLSAGAGPATAAPLLAPDPVVPLALSNMPNSTTGSAVTDMLADLQTALLCSVLGSTGICAPIHFDPTRTG